MPVNGSVELARGYFEHLDYQGGQLTLNGWLFLLEEKIDRLDLFINGRYIKSIPILIREDVAEVYPLISHAKYSGFSASVEIPSEKMHGPIDIHLIVVRSEVPIAKMETCYVREWADEMSIPPTHLMKRVSGTDHASFFRASAFKTYHDYWNEACKYLPLKNPLKILDWGCGCGRLTYLLSKISPSYKIHGCDIDREAVDWCTSNIANVEFEVVSPVPPTNYKSNYFDLVIANSVLTHLTRDMQLQWLEEMKRIISFNGLLIASIHGKFAAYFSFSLDSLQKIMEQGIYDATNDSALNGIAPDGYYRGTFQSREYTHTVYKQCFEILDYVERGAGNHQDLVIMKKSPEACIASPKTFVKENQAEIANLSEAISQKDFHIVNLEATLNSIYNSRGWKALLIYYTVRNKIFPVNSKRRKAAKFMWNLLN
jgi:ubiquinone/menaquinone biosynthesis C-methylase UbiE